MTRPPTLRATWTLRRRLAAVVASLVGVAALATGPISTPANATGVDIGAIPGVPLGVPVVFGAGQGTTPAFALGSQGSGLPVGTELGNNLRSAVQSAGDAGATTVIVVLAASDTAGDLTAAIDGYHGVPDLPGYGDLYGVASLAELSPDDHLAVATKLVTLAAQRHGLALLEPATATYDQMVADDDVSPVTALANSLRTAVGPEAVANAVLYTGGFTNFDPVAAPGEGVVRRPLIGTMAGAIATHDLVAGFWKPAAGTGVPLDVYGVAFSPTNEQLLELRDAAVNPISVIPQAGPIPWSAATLAAAVPNSTNPWGRMAVVRTHDYIWRSLEASLGAVVSEPNSAPLWSAVQGEITTFMGGLFSSGAFGGATAATSFQVVADSTTTTPTDVLAGVLNVRITFIPAGSASPITFTYQQPMLQA